MLKLLSDINNISRFDVEPASLSGLTQGSWVKFDGAIAAGAASYAVWTEHDNSEWSYDVDATGQITLMYGNYRALTDQFVGTPAVGAALYADTDGKLDGGGSGVVVAYAVAHDAAAGTLEFVTV